MEIRGTTIVVTGAAGGVGQAIVRALHAGGARVVLTGRRVRPRWRPWPTGSPARS